MELNRTLRWFYILTGLWMLLILVMGSWWLYLAFNLHTHLSALNLPELVPTGRFVNMIKWEGLFFFIFLLLLGGSLFYMYLRDLRKTKGLQAFFASLTHELKTPLASMRLQAEVIKDLIADESHDHAKLSDLTQRLIEDTAKFENELDKSLQLSRLENDGNLSLRPIDLARFTKKHAARWESQFNLNLVVEGEPSVMADEMALSIILRNLLENTLRHRGGHEAVEVRIKRSGQYTTLTYCDYGQIFDGDRNRLGELFYKHRSSKGSGIGLYLVKNLMRKMQGKFTIITTSPLTFELSFKSGEEGDSP